MPTYRLTSGAIVPEFAKPIPMHALTDGALQAVESMRVMGVARRLEREIARIVTKHGAPPPSTWEGDPVTRNARSLLALAETSGFVAHMLVDGEQCVVEGYRLEPEKVGFRATWRRGAASGFAWCTPWRYALIDDNRPVAFDSRTKVGKAGYRSPGMGTTRLSIVGSPWGLKVTYAELQRRVRAADAVAS